jgi:SAM-dependent methyltransferase
MAGLSQRSHSADAGAVETSGAGQPATPLEALDRFVSSQVGGGGVRIYEAGGGSVSWLSAALRPEAEVVVVDIDGAQIGKNSYAQKKIQGDIQTYSFPPDSFDLVVCYNVIEHLDSPADAIGHFHAALAPDGLLVIGAPHPHSFSSLVTRLTPHWFHVWYYRVMLRKENAGLPGEPPFPVVYDRLVAPEALTEFCSRLGFDRIYFRAYESPRYREMRMKRPLIGTLIFAITTLLNGLTLNRTNVRTGDYHAVFKKRIAATTK